MVAPLRVIRARPRLFSSAALALVVTAVLAVTTTGRLETRALVGWDVGVAVYLVLAFHMMATSEVSHIRRRAAMQDEGQLAILGTTIAAPLASLGAIVAELAATDRSRGGLVLAIVTIVLSWAFIHTTFSLHYAHEFYDREGGGGMAFPGGEEEPDYWDFVYFSFVIGMTSQVSDVGVTTKQIRRTVAIHGVVAFLFNTAILALTVNIAASG